MPLTPSPLAHEDLPSRPVTPGVAPADLQERIAGLQAAPGLWFIWSTYAPTFDFDDDPDVQPWVKTPARVTAQRMRHRHTHETHYLRPYREHLEWRTREYPTDKGLTLSDLEVRWVEPLDPKTPAEPAHLVPSTPTHLEF